MSSKRRWWLTALGSLIALTALGSWGCCSVTCCDKRARNQLVLVSADGDKVSIDPIVVSQRLRHEIVWRLPAESTIASIAITPRDKTGPAWTPFERCEMTADVCRIACVQRVCMSGAVNPAPPVTKPIYYDYAFTHPVTGASLDPGIRIDP